MLHILYRHKNQCLKFAHDIALMTRTKRELEMIVLSLIKTVEEVGLELNAKKTKYMAVRRNREVGNRGIKINMRSGKN